MMNLEEFRKSGRNIRFDDIREPHLKETVTQEFGRMYRDNLVIELLDDGSAWSLILMNESYADKNLEKLEKMLYDFYVSEIAVNENPPEPDIQVYQIEIRGRIQGSHALFGIKDTIVENQWNYISRYDVIASSPEEACDYVREYENSGRREHELVKCTMRKA